MRVWLGEALQVSSQALSENESAEGYLRGRGMTSQLMLRLGIGVWTLPETPCPDADFVKRYGTREIKDWITIPMLSPRGQILGFEARSWQWADGKKISDYRLPESRWNPVFIGMTPDVMQKIWSGANVWVCEGVFDLAALDRIVPETDVVLATLRAKLSEQHVNFFKRFVRKPSQVYMVYDRDETGRKQTDGWLDTVTKQHRWGALDLLKRVSVDCQDVFYDGGKDPGEIWDHGGEAALRETFKHVLP